MRPAVSRPTKKLWHEEKMSSSNSLMKIPRKKRLKRNNNCFQEKKKDDWDVELNDPRRQRPPTTTMSATDNLPFYARSKQDNRGITDFSVPTTRGTFLASKHRSPHKVRDRDRVRVG